MPTSLALDPTQSCRRIIGTVYGVLANHPSLLEVLGAAVREAPYEAPPRAPVLFIKPRNTLAGPGDPLEVPPDEPELECAATVGVVIGRTACRLDAADALDHVAGFVIVNDVGVPHASYHRPPVRHKARDGFCPVGPVLVARESFPAPDAIEVRSYVDGQLVQRMNTAEMIRPLARLLADVTGFMSLRAGDVLCVGARSPAPRVRPGQTITIEVDGIGALSNPVVRGSA